MKQLLRVGVAIAIIALGLTSACSKSKPAGPQPSPIKSQRADTMTLSQSQNGVGFQLFSKLVSEEPQKNVVISPFSISEALLMAWSAAEGSARDLLIKTLQMPGVRDDDIKAQNRALLEKQGITIGNSLWVKDFNGVPPSFLKDAKDYFHAEVEPLKTAAEINAWVARVTGGVIKTIIGSVDDLKCVIVNAIYFKELWVDAFNSKLTKDADFWRASKDSIQRAFMNKGDYYFAYFEDAGLQAVKLPYQKKGLAMVVFLPPQSVSPAAFPKLLEKNWTAWLQRFSSRNGTVSLPRFKIEYDNDKLADTLGVSGIPIAVVKGLISQIIHKTYIKVDEKGTEAAAATAAVIPEGIPSHEEPPPFLMQVNRPFFFAIYNKETGSILFLGFIADPVQE